MINVASVEDGNDIISNGVLQKSFDNRITLKEDLNYIPYEKQIHTIYINTPAALAETPTIKSSAEELQVFSQVKQSISNDANKISL